MTRSPAVVRTLFGARGRARGSRDRLVAFQEAMLRRVVRHAYATVPYYRQLFDGAGLDPRRVRGLGDLPLIPITTKADLRARPVSEILARGADPGRLLRAQTSGSSGHPFVVYRTWLESALQYVLRLRAFRDLNVRLTDRTAGVGLARLHDPRDHKIVGRLLAAAGVKRRITIDGLEPPEAIVARLAEWRPEVIAGMSGMLCRIAEHILRHRVRGVQPRLVIVGGEVTTPRMRQRLEEAFGAPVLETYASHEVPLLGWQCAGTGAFHVCDDGVILEVVRDGVAVPPGERGEVVATNLHAYAMPLIRYRVADVVTRGDAPCACGAPFSTIGAVEGRTVDLFPLADGRVVSPYDLLTRTICGDDAWLAQYQLLQERRDRVVLRVVPIAQPGEERLARMAGEARAFLGPDIEFEIILVDDLPLEPTGKFRPLRSLVHAGSGTG